MYIILSLVISLYKKFKKVKLPIETFNQIRNFYINKNESIHKSKFKKSDDQTNFDKYRVTANITKFQNIYQN